MSTFTYTIENLINATGLQRKYIDRCFSKVPYILGPHRRKRDGNKYWYDHGSFEIFQRVANLKQQGKTLSAIQEWLESEFGSRESNGEEGREVSPNARQSNGEVGKVQPQADHQSAVVDPIGKVEELYERLLTVKDSELAKQQEITKALQREMSRLLPEGKTPEEVTEERVEKDRRLSELQAQSQTEQGRRRQLDALMLKLEALPWYAKNRQREIIAQMRGIEAVDESEEPETAHG